MCSDAMGSDRLSGADGILKAWPQARKDGHSSRGQRACMRACVRVCLSVCLNIVVEVCMCEWFSGPLL